MATRRVQFTAIQACVALVVLGLLPSAQQAEAVTQPKRERDRRIRIVSPQPGQIFAPGETIDVVLQIDRSLQPMMGTISLSGDVGSGFMSPFAMLDETALRTTPVRAAVTIPNAAAGTVAVSVMIQDVSQVVRESEPVTITVRPRQRPLKLVIDPMLLLTLPLSPDEEPRLYPIAVYEGGVERNVSAAAAGTIYRSSNSSVAVVDVDGRVIPRAPGVTVMTAEHNGVKGFTIVEIAREGAPLSPEDVTALLRIERGMVRNSPEPDHAFVFVQDLRITNTGDIPVAGPLYVVLSNLPPGVKPWQMGVTETIVPLDSPMEQVPLPTTGLSLVPGESVAVRLQFLGPDPHAIRYDLRVFRTQDP